MLVASGLAAYDDTVDDRKNRNIPSEILYVVLRNNKVSSIFSTLAEVCPAQGNKGFGGSWNGKCIVGVGRDVYWFKESECQWKEIICTNKPREYSSSCSIGQNGIVVIGGWEGSSKSSAEFLNFDSKPPSSGFNNSNFWQPTKVIPTFGRSLSWTKRQNDTARHFKWNKCLSKIPVSLNDGTPAQIWGHTITYVGNKKIILVGGRALAQRPYIRETTKCVLEGQITDDNCDIKWKSLSPISTARFGHLHSN